MHPDQRADSPADMFQPILLTVVRQMIASKLGGNDLSNNGQHGMLRYVSWTICCLHMCQKLLKGAVCARQSHIHLDFLILPWQLHSTMLADRHVRPTNEGNSMAHGGGGRGEKGEEQKFQA